MAGGDPLQQPGNDPWARGAARGGMPGLAAPQPRVFPGGERGGKGGGAPLRVRQGGKGGGKGGPHGGLREDQLQRLETRIQELMNDILHAGGCPTSAGLLETVMAELRFPETQHLDISRLRVLSLLVKKEQALKQFLLAMRSLCSVWSVKDAERAFMASSFVKRSYDVAEWGSLRLGPSLSQHPFWAEVFYEFSVSQAKWTAHATDPKDLMDGVRALELLFQHRVDSSGLNGKIDFDKEIRFEEFQQWLYSRGILLEDCGVCINRHKFGLVMGSMNGALAQQDRLQQQAEAKYLEKLLELKEGELNSQLAAESDDAEAYEDFHHQWRKASRSQLAAQLADALCLWAKRRLGCDTKALRPLAMTLAVELKASEAGPGIAARLEDAAAGAMLISPLELEDTVRRQLDAVDDAAGRSALGLSGLARLERLSLGPGATMEAMPPGEGTFLNFLSSKADLCDFVEQRLMGALSAGSTHGEVVHGGTASTAVDVSDMLRKADEALLKLRPSGAVLDAQLLAQLEEKLRSSGVPVSSFPELLARGRNQRGSLQRGGKRTCFGSGWAMSVQDVKAFELLQGHGNFILRSCGAAAYQHHFGASSGALGLPPLSEPRGHGGSAAGLHFEAAVLAQLCRRQEVPASNGGPASSEGQAASRAAEALARWNSGGSTCDLFQDVEDSYHIGGRHSTAQQALESLAAVEYLEDVESSSSWQALHASSLGSLEDFLSRQGEQLQKYNLRFLVLAPGSLSSASLAPRLVRLPWSASVEQLQQAVASGQAKTAAAQLAALCVDEPQAAEALGYYLKEGLKTLKQRFHGASPAAVSCSLAVTLLQFLPCGLRPHLGKLLVLPCLKEEVCWAEECRTAAGRLGCSSMLLVLGNLWDVRSWNLDAMQAEQQTGELQFLRALGVSHDAAAADSSIPIRQAPPETVRENDGAKTTEKNGGEESGEDSTATPASPVFLQEGEKYDILHKIRREFCLDQSNAAQLQRNLGGALKRLGEDLYREQHHFVFELLQNGDDNKYHMGEVPCYKLILCENMLVALSNELGFEEANVLSLCSVDSSTKPQSSDGAERIGKKGIGFKSVFKITDTPIIHSNGWHFRFNARLESELARKDIKELGYIVPEPMPKDDMQFPQWTTEIRLPFKPELGNDEKAVLEEDFEDLDGTLLLNLNKIRCLVLQQCSSSQLRFAEDAPLQALGRCLRSTDLCDEQRCGDVRWRLVQISDVRAGGAHEKVMNWLCVEGAFPFSAKDSKMVRIKISFPLPASDSLSKWRKEEEPAPQQTFCYLPLRSFGWCFVLHANFDVTASRNELHSSAWNRKIKEQLPKMLCLSQRIIQDNLMPHGSAGPFEPLSCVDIDPSAEPVPRTVPYGFFLRFMPLYGDLGGGASDFFMGMESKIWQLLKEEKCVRSAEGCWMQPSHIFQAPEVMKEVIQPELLAEFHSGLCYMHADFGTGLRAETLQHLGVRTPGSALDVLLTVLKNMVAAEAAELSSVDFVRKVLALCYKLMWGYQEDSAEDASAETGQRLERLRDLQPLRLLPLQRSASAPPGLASAGCGAIEEGLFLPEELRSFPQALLDCLDLKIVSPELFTGKDGQLVRRLLTSLKVRVLSPAAVVLEGVMPLLETLAEGNDAQALRRASLCLAYLASVKLLDVEAAAARRFRRGFQGALRSCLRVPCIQQDEVWLQPISDQHSIPILLSPEFHQRLAEDALSRQEVERVKAHQVLMQAVAETRDATTAPHLLVAADELQLGYRQLADFLAKHCDVTMGGFQVVKQPLCLAVGELGREKPHFKEAAEELAASEDTNILAQHVDLVDYESPSLAIALAAGSDISGLLVASYVVELREHLTANLTMKQSNKSTSLPSSIAAILTSSSWVQGTVRSCKPFHARFLWEDGELASPESRLKPALKRFLENHMVLISDAHVPCQLSFRDMLKHLGAQQLSSKDVLELLREWSTTKSQSTEGEMTNAYEALHVLQQHRRCTEVDGALQDNDEKLIFVPNEVKLTKRNSNQDRNVYEGKWLSPSSCCVREDTRVSHNVCILSRVGAVRELELHYGLVLKEPFLKTCGIAEWPTETHRLHSLELAGRNMRPEVAERLSALLLEQTFAFAGPGQQRRYGEQMDAHFKEGLRREFAKFHALPTNQGWMAWRLEDGEAGEVGDAPGEDDPFCREIFLPDRNNRNTGDQVVLDWCLRNLFRYFQQLGMRFANAAGPAVQVQAEAAPAPAEEVQQVLEMEGEQEDSAAETKLRVAMAYLQCWISQVQTAPLYHALEARATHMQLSRFRICVAERLMLGGREVECHLVPEQLLLYVAQPTEGLALQPLNAALRLLLLRVLGLAPAEATSAENVGIEVLIRLAESERPGLAARSVLQNFGCTDADPSKLQLTWWFGLSPLELEEAQPTAPRRSRAAPAAADTWTGGAAPPLNRDNAWGHGGAAHLHGGDAWGHGGAAQPPNGGMPATLHAPMAAPQGDAEDPWANWLGLAADGAPLLRQAAEVARRAGRPHQELEAYALELEGFAQGHGGRGGGQGGGLGHGGGQGHGGGHGGHGEGHGEVGGPGGTGHGGHGEGHGEGNGHGGGGRGGAFDAQWAESRAREVEDFLQGLGREDRDDAPLLNQLRRHSAELRALAAAGAFAQDPLAAPPGLEAAGAAAAAAGAAEAAFATFEAADLHLQPAYAADMEALQEDAPNNLALPTAGRLSPEEERQVAEWGEEWVFKTLQRKYARQADVQVHWLNQQGEQFDFCDISVVFGDGRQDFYEVKSTVTMDKRLLEVSEKQVIEASKLKDRFNIVRVFNAGGPNARMLLVPNPSAQCINKATTGIELLLKLP